MEVIAVRPVTIGGQTYQAGDSVKELSPEKAAQLVNLRILRRASEEKQEYVVTKAFTIRGKVFKRGDKTRVKTLSPDKLHQLLEQRFLEPAPANG